MPMPPGSGPMHQLSPLSLPSDNVSLSAGLSSMTRSQSSKFESDPCAPSSDEQNATALSPLRLQWPMIETVDQLRIKSDSNIQMLRIHLKNLAKRAFSWQPCVFSVRSVVQPFATQWGGVGVHQVRGALFHRSALPLPQASSGET